MPWLNAVLGRPLASDEEDQEKLNVATGVPTFGLDALGSAAYGPEAALTVLLPAAAAGLAYVMPISIVIVSLLVIVFFSYLQTVAAYPQGGGAYTVAGKNLGEGLGLLAAAALVLDYLLDVGVGISTGVGALVSAVPSLLPHTLVLCLFILAVLTFINLRGAGESGVAFMVPTYLFIFCLLSVLGLGVWKAFAAGGHPHAIVPPPQPAHAAAAVTAWLLIRAFAGGCTALTGVEAVSNGVNAFKNPAVQTARRTLTIIVVLLALFLVGIAYTSRAYGVLATPPGSAHYQSLLSSLTAAVAGKGVLYYTTLGSILIVLSLSANTAFAGFPRLCCAVSADGYLPAFFGIRGRRLVYTEGIVVLAVLAAVVLIAFGGVTDRLIPLFAIGAFLSFTLSQAGMVMHWRRERGQRATFNMLLNGTGAVATGVTTVIVLVAKFAEGAWITVIAVPLLVALMYSVRRHYDRVRKQTAVHHLSLEQRPAPLMVVPVSRWDKASESALRFACSITPHVQVLHINAEGEQGEESCHEWQQLLDACVGSTGVTPPRLVSVTSSYRAILTPILKHVQQEEGRNPGRMIGVVIPELVAESWYHYLLHNHRSTLLKAQLLVRGNRRIVVVNVPWYLS